MTVLRLLLADEIALHRIQLCDWMRANNVDPDSVNSTWVSIERDGQEPPVIRYQAFKVNAHGRRMVDPDDGTRVWVEQRTAPLIVPLPELTTPTATRPTHGTDDSYPYGGDYDAGREYTLTCYCGREFTGDLDGTVERDYDEHISDAANGPA